MSTTVPNHKSLIETARKLYQQLDAASQNQHLGQTLREAAEKAAKRIDDLSILLGQLHSKDPTTAASSANTFFATGSSPLTLEEARTRVIAELNKEIALTKNSTEFKGIIRAIGERSAQGEVIITKTSTAQAVEVVEEIEKKPFFLSRWIKAGFDKHQTWMEGHSPEGRLGFAVGEMAVGGILTDVGGRWLSQAISGLQQKHLTRNDGPPNEKGEQRTVTELVMEPMSTNQRLLKGVVGGVTAGAGAIGTGLGLYNLYRSMMQ